VRFPVKDRLRGLRRRVRQQERDLAEGMAVQERAFLASLASAQLRLDSTMAEVAALEAFFRALPRTGWPVILPCDDPVRIDLGGGYCAISR